MKFETAYALYGLLLIPGLVLLLKHAISSRNSALERFGDLPLVQRLTPETSARRIWLTSLLSIASIALIVVALARPQFGLQEDGPRRLGQDIVVALDVSNSMLAEDMQPNRLSRAKQAVTQLLAGLAGDRIGLVAFAGQAFVQCPLTSDYAAAQLFVNAMTTDSVPTQGTDIGKALQVALEAFDAKNTEHRVLILITDGEDHEGEIAVAVDRAIRLGVRVYSIGIGDRDAVLIPFYDPTGKQIGFQQDSGGAVVSTRLQDRTLEEIARRTGGEYQHVGRDGDLMTTLADEIAEMAGREFEAENEVVELAERFQIFVGLALILLIVELLWRENRGAGRSQPGKAS